MEKIVETWLDNNPDWFRTYAMRSLDHRTVNDWIAQNKGDSTHGAKENHRPEQDGIEKLIHFKPTLKKYTVKFASTEQANQALNSAELFPGQQQRANRSQSLTTRTMQEYRTPQQQLPSKNRTMAKLKIPSLDVESIRHKSNSPPNPQIKIEDEKHMFFIKDDTSEMLNNSNSNGLSSNAIGPSYSPNNETHNLISLNMVKRSKLIAMRKYNTMVPNTHHQSLDEILTNTKQKLAMSLAASQVPLTLANNSSNNKKENPEFLVEVIKDISSELDLKLLSKKIVNNVKLMVDTDEVALFFVTRNSTQSTAFKSTIYSYVNDKRADSEVKAIVETNYFLKRVIETGEFVNIKDVQKEKETNLMLSKVSPQTKSVLCIPIKNPAGQVLAVVQFTINSDSSHEKPGGFTDTDINVSSFLNKKNPLAK